MRAKHLWGLIPALIYVAVAVGIVAQEFNCGGGLDINLCGIGTALITAPSQIVLGNLFSRMGWEINFMHSLDIVDVTLLTIHIGFSALFVGLAGYGFGWIVRRVFARLEKAKTGPTARNSVGE
jgi:hypothetical protein